MTDITFTDTPHGLHLDTDGGTPVTLSPVTVTRDDPAALLELVESLADGQKVTAEWRSKDGERATSTTGPVGRDVDYECINVRGVWGEDNTLSACGHLHATLYSVTATATKTIRWEREA